MIRFLCRFTLMIFELCYEVICSIKSIKVSFVLGASYAAITLTTGYMFYSWDGVYIVSLALLGQLLHLATEELWRDVLVKIAKRELQYRNSHISEKHEDEYDRDMHHLYYDDMCTSILSVVFMLVASWGLCIAVAFGISEFAGMCIAFIGGLHLVTFYQSNSRLYTIHQEILDSHPKMDMMGRRIHLRIEKEKKEART